MLRKQLMRPVWGIPVQHILILLTVWIVVHSALVMHFGVRQLFDSADYIRSADGLLQSGGLDRMYYVFYLVPLVLIGIFRALFEGQIIPFLIFQCAVSFFATLALYRSAAKVFDNPLAGLFSGLIFLAWWDNIQWNTTVMTESLMCSAICFLVFQITHFKNRTSDYGWIVFWLVIIGFTRPTGIVVIVGAIAFMIVCHWNIIRKSRWRFLIHVVLVLITSAGAMLMFSIWDFTEQYARGNIITYMNTMEGQALYDGGSVMATDDLEFAAADKHPLYKMGYFIVHNPVYFIKAAALKIWYLISGMRPYYSNLHNGVALFWVMCIYAMCVYGWRQVQALPVKVFVITVIVVNGALIGLATVDWDNRFYIPMEPCIVLLAGGGAAALFTKLIGFNHRVAGG